MKYSVTNRAAEATSITATSVAAGYAVTSLHSKRRADVLIFGTPAVNDEIRFNWGSAKTVKGVFVHNHNFESDAVFQLEHSQDNFAADIAGFGNFSGQAVVRGFRPDLFKDTANNDLAKQYFRVRCSTLGSQTAKWKVGELVVVFDGDLVALVNFVWGFVTGREMNNQMEVTPGGSPWSYHLSDLGHRFSIAWRGQDLANTRAVEAMFAAMRGRHLPASFLPFESSADPNLATEAYYCRLGSDRFDYTNVHLNDKHSAVVLVEDPTELVGTAA